MKKGHAHIFYTLPVTATHSHKVYRLDNHSKLSKKPYVNSISTNKLHLLLNKMICIDIHVSVVLLGAVNKCYLVWKPPVLYITPLWQPFSFCQYVWRHGLSTNEMAKRCHTHTPTLWTLWPFFTESGYIVIWNWRLWVRTSKVFQKRKVKKMKREKQFWRICVPKICIVNFE